MPDVLDGSVVAPPLPASGTSPVKAESLIGSLLRQAQQHQQMQQQQAAQQNMIAANSSAASAAADAMVDEPAADGSGSNGNGHASVASPIAGPLARALSIPSFQHNNGGSPYKQPAAAAASSSSASSAMSDSAAASSTAAGVYTPSPSKRSKFHDRASPSHGASVASPLLAGALGALPPPSLGGACSEPSTPEQPARTLSISGSKNGHDHSSSGHTMLGMMQGGAAAPQQQHSSPGSGSLQKRRNSGTAALHLTAAPLASSMHNGPSLSASARKPPAYPAGPSNPSTPSMLGRSLPINIGSGSRRNSSHSSGMLPAPAMSGAGAGAGTGHLSPSQTPPGTPQLPIPRSMLPQSPLTPALGPDRSIPVINAQGQLQRVNSQQMNSYMNNVEEVVLPPQAAPNQSSSSSSGHQHGHKPPQAAQRGHSAGTNTPPSKVSPPQPSTPAPVVAPVHVAEPQSAPAVIHTPITPVKHLVKLSSLSSLSSLISTAAPPANHSTPAAATAGTPMSPPSASSDQSPGSSPTSGSSSRCSSSLGPGAPVLLPAPPAIAPTYLILDIDETIHVNAHSPCLMMCEKGLEMYQRIISSHANYRQVAYSHKSALTKTLQAALQSKRTVEPETAALLNSLQTASGANNIRIFGLTARFSHMASTTRKELLKLGIDLEKSSPFPQGVRKRHAAKGGGNPSPLLSPSPTHERSLTPSPVMCAAVAPLGSSPGGSSMSALQLPASAAPSVPYFPDISWNDHPSFGTEARYQSGVIFTNACEKGPVLSRFLEFLWGQIEEENQEVLAHNQQVLAQHALAMQQYQAALSSVTLNPPTSSRSLDDLAGQLASATHHSPASPTGSHSIMQLNHAVTHPIPIGGAAATAYMQQNTAQPSPPDTSMAMLAAASQSANANKPGGAGASPSPLHARRTSKTTHLAPPHTGAQASDGASPQSADPHAASQPAQLQSLSLLPTRLIFIDDRLQNCFSVYDSLSAATLFDAFYNNSSKRSRLNHVPSALEVYTCHYVPVGTEHAAPTNQTKADAAATAAANAASAAHAEGAVDIALIEAQIHHFLTHGEILNDSKGRALLARLREEEEAVKKRMADADATAKSLAIAAAQEHQRAAQAAAAAAAEADRLREMADVSAAQSSAGSSVSSTSLISSALMEDCESAPQSQPPTPPSPALNGSSSSGNAASSEDPNAVMAATPRNGVVA